METSDFATSQFTQLLETVTDLKNDLDKTLTELHSLRSTNEMMKRENETLVETVEDTRQKYVEAQENYMTTVSSKVEMEKHYEQFLAKKAYELQEKTNEFEQLRDKFIPQDIDYIRVKVIKEAFRIRFSSRVFHLFLLIVRILIRNTIVNNGIYFMSNTQGTRRARDSTQNKDPSYGRRN